MSARACARCGRAIAGTVKDPIVEATSLGAGSFHDACAKEIWAEQRRAESEKRERIAAQRAAHARRVFGGSP